MRSAFSLGGRNRMKYSLRPLTLCGPVSDIRTPMVTAVFRPAAIVHTPYQAPAAIFSVYSACSFHSG